MNLRVMLVDDNAAVRSLLRRMLEATNLASLTFVESGDGCDALSKFEPTRFDLILVDMHMPGGDGLDFVRKARAFPGGEGVKYVMVTGEGSSSTVESALGDVGPDAILAKPVGLKDLVGVLQPLIH